jgi:succinylarginine dihydrolase
MPAREFNFDGLVGPTHNYAGLSSGNIASLENRGAVSNPRAAALEGLAKMRTLAEFGLAQAVLPPQQRPDLESLRRLGFGGDRATLLASVPDTFLAACSSASAMWTANAATVAPSADTLDGRVHLVPANLHAKFHRSIEPSQTTRTLRAIFADPAHFEVHEPLPSHADFADEGAANHTRLANDHATAGIHLFAWGRGYGAAEPERFAARQSLKASEAVARLLRLPAERVVFAQNTPTAIDAGVFHNDVIAVGNTNTLLLHEDAFVAQHDLLEVLATHITNFQAIVVPRAACSLEEAVASYLFNSQLLTMPDGSVALLAPSDVRSTPRVSELLDSLLAAPNRLRAVFTQDLRQSMRNGGGPACLRLRVVLRSDEADALSGSVRFDATDALESNRPGYVTYGALRRWIERHYRDRLDPSDLRDLTFVDETNTALDELTSILGLGSIYPFQT